MTPDPFIITIAAKGSVTVAINTSDYIAKANELLHDSNTYLTLPADPIPSLQYHTNKYIPLEIIRRHIGKARQVQKNLEEMSMENMYTQRLPERRRSDNKALCYKCSTYEHVAKCKAEGHIAAQCPNANLDRENLLIGGITESKIMNAKYFKEPKINGNKVNSYIDTGSKCVTLTEADANILVLEYEAMKPPFQLSGYGSEKVTPLGEGNALAEIDQAKAQVTILIVSNEAQVIPLLLGQPFIEQDHILMVKSRDTTLLLFEEGKD
ncbi:hypothetical protein QE152_g9594 [Popillia japonica]|uniref:Peptidase A2 domain-containing protein n=1 Tax=Popillia japonica TaxID=7064 RepID=A0AAW1LYQ6_POPJA